MVMASHWTKWQPCYRRRPSCLPYRRGRIKIAGGRIELRLTVWWTMWPNQAWHGRIEDPGGQIELSSAAFHHRRDLELQWRWKSTEARSSAVRGEHHLSATLSSNGDGTHGGEAVRRAVRSIRRPSSSPPSSPSLSPPSLSQRPSLSVGPLLLPCRHQLYGRASPSGPRRRPGGGAQPWGRHFR